MGRGTATTIATIKAVAALFVRRAALINPSTLELIARPTGLRGILPPSCRDIWGDALLRL
jgi:hypothetical protein